MTEEPFSLVKGANYALTTITTDRSGFTSSIKMNHMFRFKLFWYLLKRILIASWALIIFSILIMLSLFVDLVIKLFKKPAKEKLPDYPIDQVMVDVERALDKAYSFLNKH